MKGIKQFTWRIGGEAGQGIMSAGLAFSKTAMRSGYFVIDFNEYPSLIRGGHNTYTVRACDKEIYSHVNTLDFLVALNVDAINLHSKKLSKKAGVIVNTDKIDVKSIKLPSGINVFPIPLIKLAKDIGGKEIMMNNVALGACMALLKADFQILALVIKNILSKKNKKIIDLNVKAAQAGFEYVVKNFEKSNLDFCLCKKNNSGQILVSGSEAIGLGAIKAGMKFFACYPMTPISPILAYVAKKALQSSLIYVQPEDEISGINMAIGAAHAGLRSMVATSGGGFSLMVEAYGLAGITETPLVIIEGQRPGPATGVPTWQGQGDLSFVLSAAQDDFFRIVLAPGDVEECFYMTIEAFNLAEIYQTPVLVLVDKYLTEGHKSVDYFNTSKVKIDRGFLLSSAQQRKGYKRYQITDSGISPRAVPGRKGNTFIANSYEHDEFGFSTEDIQTRKDQMAKRMRKLETMVKNMPEPKIYGNKSADLALVSWGSTKGAVLQAQKILRKNGIKTNFLHLNYLNPFPTKFVSRFLRAAKNVLMVEQNYSAQGAGLIRKNTGIDIKNRLLKYDTRLILPQEIVSKVKKIAR